jgi:ribonuclease VapC
LEIVEASLDRSVICSVNWAEVLQKVIARGGKQPQDVGGDLEFLGLAVVPFTAEDAMTAAEMWTVGRQAGLSLGDRACLSLARRLGLPALTTDQIWGTLSLGIDVRLIR